MLSFLAAGPNVPFTAALVLMVFIGIIELFGLGSGLIGDTDFDLDADLDADVDAGAAISILQWINLGRLPLLMLVVIFLTSFGLIGLIGQKLVFLNTGQMVPALMAIPLVLAMTIPVCRELSRVLAWVIPKDETSAVSLDTMVGRIAIITLGEARAGKPAEARISDEHGQTHYQMVEPDDPEQVFKQGDEVLVVRRDERVLYVTRA